MLIDIKNFYIFILYYLGNYTQLFHNLTKQSFTSEHHSKQSNKQNKTKQNESLRKNN